MATNKEMEDGKLPAILSYLLIGIIWYFVDEDVKKNSYVRFHAQQALVLIIGSIVYSIVLGIIFSILTPLLMFIPILGVTLLMILGLLYYVPVILGVIGIIYAATDKQKELPIIGKYGEKFKI